MNHHKNVYWKTRIQNESLRGRGGLNKVPRPNAVSCTCWSVVAPPVGGHNLRLEIVTPSPLSSQHFMCVG